jgi:hypothetical protein
VKSESSGKGVCLTDEKFSAIAPIQMLNIALSMSINIISLVFSILVHYFLETNYESGWLASVNKSINEFECIPNVHCENWRLEDSKTPYFMSSLAREFGLLKSRPWNCNEHQNTFSATCAFT